VVRGVLFVVAVLVVVVLVVVVVVGGGGGGGVGGRIKERNYKNRGSVSIDTKVYSFWTLQKLQFPLTA